jgi:pyrroloquinoline quinone biosynthesis protein B
MRILVSLLLFSIFFACQGQTKQIEESKVSILILGTVQDAGSPQIACKKKCCEALFSKPNLHRKVVSLGVVDHENNKTFILEATPDMPSQFKLLKEYANSKTETPDGIFLTHAHIGHYAGLMYLGREALGSKNVPVYTMPKMEKFLTSNGPWSQLVKLGNISLQKMNHEKEVTLTKNLTIIPFLVPHRDEFSETVGYKIVGPNKSVLFIPDIDKWSKWNINVIEEIKKVDYALLDATFFDGKEINNRDISEIPHPFVIESMELFKNLSSTEKAKIHFIHFNHNNPLLNVGSEQSKLVLNKGFNISKLKQHIEL